MTDDPQARDLEGRLTAHRKLLARLLAASSEDTQLRVGAWLSARESLTDGQSDPSAVPDDGLALEMALSDELHQISEMAYALISGECSLPGDSNAPVFHSHRQEETGGARAEEPKPAALAKVMRKAKPSD